MFYFRSDGNIGNYIKTLPRFFFRVLKIDFVNNLLFPIIWDLTWYEVVLRTISFNEYLHPVCVPRRRLKWIGYSDKRYNFEKNMYITQWKLQSAISFLYLESRWIRFRFISGQNKHFANHNGSYVAYYGNKWKIPRTSLRILDLFKYI